MTVRIPLGKCGLFALIDDDDAPLVSQFVWGLKRHPAGERYFYAGKQKPHALMHRMIVNAPKGVVVDHINGDRLDNRKANLRLCTHTENIRNQVRVNPPHKYKGVTLDKQTGNYVAQIGIGKRKYKKVRGFKTPEDAARVYDKLAIQYHGQFARLNFPASKEISA